MKSVCAWCGIVLADSPDPDDEVSHGICEPCSQFFLSSSDSTKLGSFLNRLPFPVMVVDSDVMVVDGNTAGLELVGKDREDVLGRLGGEVVECANARLPGGCGKTEHCSGCVLRRSASYTYTSGKSVTDEPCSLLRRVGEGERTVNFLVSTQKVGHAVLLKLEPAG